MTSSANYITEMDEDAPDGATQKVSVLDDYVRMLTRVLKNQFPNLTAAAVTATTADLNRVTGADAGGGIQFKGEKGVANGYASLDAGGQIPLSQLPFGDGGFPAGTRIIFQQTNAPTGWTKDTTHHNKALRLIGNGTASFSGSLDFTSVFANRTTSDNSGSVRLAQGTFSSPQLCAEEGHTHGLDMRVKYLDVIVCEKNA